MSPNRSIQTHPDPFGKQSDPFDDTSDRFGRPAKTYGTSSGYLDDSDENIGEPSTMDTPEVNIEPAEDEVRNNNSFEIKKAH